MPIECTSESRTTGSKSYNVGSEAGGDERSEVERKEARSERRTKDVQARRAAKETKNKRLRVVHYPRLMGRGYWWSNKRKKGKKEAERVVKVVGRTGGPEEKTKGMVVITSVRMESEWWARLLWVPRR